MGLVESQKEGGELFARPEYIIKLFYLDKYHECVEARRVYRYNKRIGKDNPAYRVDWEEKVIALCSHLFSKIAREHATDDKDMDMAYQIAKNPDRKYTDDDFNLAMNEINAFFEKRKYTMVEEIYGDIGKVVVDER